MKITKRLFLYILSLLFVTGLVSCNNINAPHEDDESSVEIIDEKQPKKERFPDDVSEQSAGPEYSKEIGKIAEYAPVAQRKKIELEFADEDYLKSLDELAEKRKQEILNSPDEIDLNGKRVFYISNDGDDQNNDGKSPDAPFATVYRTSEIVKPGDVVLFRRGDLFRGNWKAAEGVTYGAYGEGEKPKIYASKYHGANPDDWTLYDAENNIWRYDIRMIDIGGIFFNDGEEHAYKEIPTWNVEDKKFVIRDNGSIDFVMSEQLDNDLDFFCDATSLVEVVPLVSKPENIGYLYLRCDRGNPGEVFESVEFNPRVSCISIGGPNVTIDNLCIKHAGVHGIASGTVDNLTVTNCEFGWIGGGIQFYDEISGRVTRLGNAVEIYGGCHGYTVDNCYIYQSYDAGVTHQVRGENKYFEMFDIYYTNNLFEYNTYSVEYFLSRLEAGNKSLMKN